MAAGPGVYVEGFDEFRKGLRSVDKAWGRDIGKANKELAAEVVEKADQAAASLGGVAAHAASRGLRASARQAAATIILDAGREPSIFGAEFGGGAHGKGNPTPAGGYTTQFQPFRGNKADAGYFLYPTIRQAAESGAIDDKFGVLVDRIMSEAFPD